MKRDTEHERQFARSMGMPPWWGLSIVRIGWDHWPMVGRSGWCNFSTLLADHRRAILYVWRLVIVLAW